MKKTFSHILIFAIITSFISCNHNNKIANSDIFYSEEIKVYNDILEDIIGTKSNYKKVEGKGVNVFFLFDTLSEIINVDDGIFASDKNYLKAKFKKRKIEVEMFNTSIKIKFLRATKYPVDTIIGNTMESRLQDNLNLNKGERFMDRWVRLSRICFNPEMNKGFLDFQIWCGNMCSMGDRLEIEKNNGKWKVIKRYPGPVS